MVSTVLRQTELIHGCYTICRSYKKRLATVVSSHPHSSWPSTHQVKSPCRACSYLVFLCHGHIPLSGVTGMSPICHQPCDLWPSSFCATRQRALTWQWLFMFLLVT